MASIYLVGGAVRDKLLALPVKEQDWLVVGGNEAELLAANYLRVGKDFPVFLHPDTKEEYALARTERKVAPGYAGFEFNATADVSLEDDLMRRDLTINAIAEDADGKLHDPYHGVNDIKHKILRHVSPAFVEDPVRILRVARFAARFAHLGFCVAPETLQLMQKMVGAGEVDALVPERVWQEFHKALTTTTPVLFFQVLQECGALPILFSEITTHLQAVLQHCVKASYADVAPNIRFAAMVLPLSADEIKTLCKRLAVPSDYKNLAVLTQGAYTQLQQLNSAEDYLQLLERVDAFRRPSQLTDLLAVLQALDVANIVCEKLFSAYQATSQITAKPFLDAGVVGVALRDKIHQARLQAIAKI